METPMNASIIDLRYKTSDILAALDNREQVTILYHGKPRGTIIPLEETGTLVKVCKHAFFGMYASDTETVEDLMERLRGGRHDL
jgi:antitoxin (DNA-binding transcriptional repressor) of toxin-antitoxin stability system